MQSYDYIVVGSGLFGSVFAQQVKAAGKSVLVVEKRKQIGGNCYSYTYEDTGIIIHAYGTHIFHTSDVHIWNYINQFSAFNRYHHRVFTVYRDRAFPIPINLGTINDFFGVSLRPKDAEAFLASKREKIRSPKNLEEKAMSLMGRELYEAFIKGYTIKQWGCDPTRLPASIITRLPIRTSFFDSYYDDIYQGVPVDGYTPIFKRLLNGIPVELSVDYLQDRAYWEGKCQRVVYTGPIDRYFDYQLGKLNWRSVRFELERLGIGDYQGTSIMNYAEVKVPYTRVHEPKHLHPEKPWNQKSTVVMREYSQNNPEEPYYPVNFDDDKVIHKKYESLAEAQKKMIFGGRLAQYKYFDMHQVIGGALAAAKRDLQG